MTKPCGCCEGTAPVTPEPTANRPGLDALDYRVGTHATFLETMTAALSSGAHPELEMLTTRQSDDPAIAMLDAWATVADVLTFYQERICNEGYLRTASERRSILELARLVGYRLHPGVAASVYLAFTLDEDQDTDVPAGTRAQSIPGPGELPQSFETAAALPARTEWNELRPRQTRPQHIDLQSAKSITTLYLEGTETNLKPNDPLLFTPQSGLGRPVLRYVERAEADHDFERTKITLQEIPLAQVAASFAREARHVIAGYTAEAVRPRGTTADDVVEALFTIERKLEEDAEAGAELLTQKVHAWRAVHESMPDSYTTLKPWMGGLVSDLEARLSALPTGTVLRRDQPEPSAFVNLRREQPDDAQAFTVLREDQPDQQILNGSSATGEPETASSSVPTGKEQIKMEGSLLPILGTFRLIPTLLAPPSIQPSSPQHLARSAAQTFDVKGDMALQIVGTVLPGVKKRLYRAMRGAGALQGGPTEVHALRTRASLFGHNATKKPLSFNTATGEITEVGEWPVIEDSGRIGTHITQMGAHEEPDVVHLDAAYDEILPGSWIVVETQETSLTDLSTVFAKVREPKILARAEYGLAGKATRIELEDPEHPGQSVQWIRLDISEPNPDEDFQAIRQTVVYAQSDRLALAEEPISSDEAPDPVGGERIELDDLYDGLKSGRWLVVSGERADTDDLGAIEANERVMLSGVEQGLDPRLPGDTPHTTLILANSLAYAYKRDSAIIYGNVVKATHGETREEVLGSGDGSKELQSFTLKQSPLTHVAAPTPDGADSTLEVRVNDVLWHEAASLISLAPDERGYITETDNEDKTSVIFGDGKHGARLPTGPENVAANYRFGIGEAGNVDDETISLLATKPLGVKSVVNPLPASGGADRESREQARRNAPLAVMALDRLVSVQDYADFATTFAGIAKASAVRLPDGRRQLVHVTIAGVNDMLIDETSDLYHNLVLALQRNGDPYQPFHVDLRELMLLVASAKVRLHADYRWESVEPAIRSALLDAFSFEKRELGQDVVLSEVHSVIQSAEGVAYSDVDLLDTVSEREASDMGLLIRKLEKLMRTNRGSKRAIPGHRSGRASTRARDQTRSGRGKGLFQQSGVEERQRIRLRGGPRARTDSPRSTWEGRIVVEMARSIQGRILPAQLTVFSRDLPDTLILTELT